MRIVLGGGVYQPKWLTVKQLPVWQWFNSPTAAEGRRVLGGASPSRRRGIGVAIGEQGVEEGDQDLVVTDERQAAA